MLDPLPIKPLQKPLTGELTLPGSKSITNRALILAALAEGKTTLRGALMSRDTELMIAALKTLGYSVETDSDGGEINVEGASGKVPTKEANLHVGNAGTVARFVTALAARGVGGTYQFDGDAAMLERPVSGLTDALAELGAADFEFHGKKGHFPFTMRAKGFNGGRAAVDARASSQILSALLLAADPQGGEIELSCEDVRPSYVDLSLKMRDAFAEGGVIQKEGDFRILDLPYRAPADGTYTVEPDLSAASYFLALTLIQGGSLELPNLGPDPLQGDARFAEVMAHHGLRVEPAKGTWQLRRDSGDDVQRGHREIDFEHFSDTFLTYAAIAPLLGGSVRICGIGHTRRQETDRITGMANELSKLGQLVKEEEGALTIQPKPNEIRARALKAVNDQRCIEIDTYEDHRFAMSFAILGSFDLLGDGTPWLAIRNPACCGKTFPGFFEALEGLRIP